MKGWILCDRSNHYEVEALLKQEGNLQAVYPGDLHFAVGGSMYYQGEAVKMPDLIIGAFQEEVTSYNLAVLRQLEFLGAYCVNPAEVIIRCNDKLLTSQILHSRNIPVAVTALYRKGMELDFIEQDFTFPLVVKVKAGAKGKGVVLVRDVQELRNVLEMSMADELLIQEYIASSRGRDIRVLTVGQEIVGYYMRSSTTDFRSNIALGGSMAEQKVTSKIRDLALKTAEALGLRVGGIDLLLTEDGYVVGEANAMPGFSALKGTDIAGRIIKKLYHLAQSN